MSFRLKTLINLVFIFVVAQSLGVLTAYESISSSKIILPDKIESVAPYDIIILLLFGVVFIYFITKFKKAGGLLYKIIFSLLIFGGTQTVFAPYFPVWVGIIFGLLGAFLFLFWNNIFIQNVIIVVTMAGVGSILGLSFSTKIIVIGLIVLSAYDVFAVLVSGHMVQMANTMIEARAIPGIVIPEKSQPLSTSISEVKTGEGFMILGTGDIILPLLLSVSLIQESLKDAFIVAGFSVLGVILMYIIFSSQKVRRPMPALPPIALMTILGYFIVIFI